MCVSPYFMLGVGTAVFVFFVTTGIITLVKAVKGE